MCMNIIVLFISHLYFLIDKNEEIRNNWCIKNRRKNQRECDMNVKHVYINKIATYIGYAAWTVKQHINSCDLLIIKKEQITCNRMHFYCRLKIVYVPTALGENSQTSNCLCQTIQKFNGRIHFFGWMCIKHYVIHCFSILVWCKTDNE